MAPDTQSIDCTPTFLTSGLALAHPFDNSDTSIHDPEDADREALSAAIKRVDLDDDDDDEEDEEEDDDFNEEDDVDEDEGEDDEEYEDDDEEDEDEDEDDDLDDEEDHDDEDDIKLI
jgi:hypothetical protein